ncbi:MAG: beta-mannosidase [Candidatus Limivicinus sp.]|jgi:beta-mannosidase
MKKYDLNGIWQMRKSGTDKWISSQVPGSVCSTLLEHHLADDPYYGENEAAFYSISLDDYEFQRVFTVSGDLLRHRKILLHFDGLDTLADIYINGTWIAHTENMHRRWEFDVKSLLTAGENTIRIFFRSPVAYVTEKQREFPLYGSSCTTDGYPHLRKAHYMFGWDWGPKIPDMGIWRPVYLIFYDEGRLDSVYVRQRHREGRAELSFDAEAYTLTEGAFGVHFILRAPDGSLRETDAELSGGRCTGRITVKNPLLWWPNGYGAQPLYNLTAVLLADGREIDRQEMRIGLRTLTVSRERDRWGQEFCFKVNGVRIFAMGANYIPEDQLISRCTRERSRELLSQCAAANYNTLRVWGGGYYPEDWFLDICDELGLIVWQDFMFACSAYRVTGEFQENVRQECIDNVKRLRNHACLGLWCGNNECETMWEDWGIPQSELLRQDYLRLFEKVIPEVLQRCDPETFYWPSSPSCGGNFDSPSDCSRGDEHYWDVWHGMKPLTEFRRIYFRFCSEYGFEALPNVKTVRRFAPEDEMNLCSAVLESHHKCTEGNKKLLYYLSQMLRCPNSFEDMVYSTQLLQADAIRSNVEHMRRNRGRCMGSLYWQANDSNPAVSWSGIDCEGRWKALHYYARRFYAPLLLSVNEEDAGRIIFNISNERFRRAEGILRWELRDSSSQVLRSSELPAEAEPLSAKDVLVLDLSGELETDDDRRSRYLSYRYEEDGKLLSGGSSLFVMPKHFRFINPCIHADIEETEDCFLLTLKAAAYAKSVCLDLKTADCVFSDNWFDIHGREPVNVAVEKSSLRPALTLSKFSEQLVIFSNYDNGRT